RLAPECLVFVDVADNEAERIGEEHGVRYCIAEAVKDIRGPTFAALFGSVAGRAEDLLELNLGTIGLLAQIDEIDRFDLDVYVRRAGVEQKRLQGLLLVHPLESGGLQLVREEIERLREVPLQRRVIAAVVELAPAGRIILAHAIHG